MMAALAFQNIESPDLGPLKEPEAIGFSFETPGWYILGAILILLATYLFIKWLQNHIRNAYRREALSNLHIIESEFRINTKAEYLRDALVLLKLVAIKTFGREKVAQLHGDEWLVFLEESGKETPFTAYAPAISAALYHSSEVQIKHIEPLLDLCKKWIKTHA